MDGDYVIDWEDSGVEERIRETLNFLDKGCSCKGGCTSRRCGCKKNGRTCGIGCECRDCKNIQATCTKHKDRSANSSDDEGEAEEEEEEEDGG